MTALIWIDGYPMLMAGLLAVLAAVPLLLVMALTKVPRKTVLSSPMTLGNALVREEADDAPEELLAMPLVHLIRTTADRELRGLMLGLRFAPIEQGEPLLRPHVHSKDPELQMYAQSVLQDGLEKLQSRFLRLRSCEQKSPANIASLINAGLRLLHAPFTPESERAAILDILIPKADDVLHSHEEHPRLIFESARLSLEMRRIDDAETLLQRLPERSPLQASLQHLVDHQRSIAQPFAAAVT